MDIFQHFLATLEGRYGFDHADYIVVVQVFHREDVDVPARLASDLDGGILAIETFPTDAVGFVLFFLFLLALLFFDGTFHDALVHFLHVDVLHTETGSQQGNLDLIAQ